MLSDEKKLAICENIIKSNVFQKSPKSSALLRYLVKATIAGDYLKEDIIDLEFFGDTTQNKNSPRVRVNIYNLRKKLNKYYETDGKDVVWRLFIDKGQYSVRFDKQKLTKTKLQKIKLKHVLPYLLLVILGILFIINNLSPTPPILWNSFFKNGKANTLIIGDVFGIKGKTITGGLGWTRDYNINSTEEYYKYIEKNETLKLITKPANYKYTTGMAAVAAQNVSKLFYSLNVDFGIRFSSNIAVADFKKGNLIYVGQHVNNNKMRRLFNDFNPYFKIVGNNLHLTKHPKLNDRSYHTYFGEENNDFSIISKFKGPKGNQCFLFFSNHDIGVKAAIESFTNKEFLKEFNKKYMGEKENFTAIYKANGNDRINLGLEKILVVPF